MGKLFSWLKQILRNEWFIILWILGGGVLIRWFFIAKPYLEILGITSDTISTFFGVVAALSGVLLGLIIAAISFTTQYWAHAFYNSRDILSRELQSVESFIATNSFQNHELYNNLLTKLENLCDICWEVLYINIKEEEFNKYKDIVTNAIEVAGHFRNVHRYKINLSMEELDKLAIKDPNRDEIQAKSIEIQNMKKEILCLNDLQRSVLAMSSAIIRIMVSSLSSRLSRYLVWLAYMVGFISFFSIVFLVLSGITLSGITLLSEWQKICFAILIVWSLVPVMVMIFRIVSLHLMVAGIEVHNKLSF